jgi:hypothetical protein
MGNAPAELKAAFLARAAERRGPEMEYYSENPTIEGDSSELVSLVKDLMEEVRQLRAEREADKLPVSSSVKPSAAPALLLPAPKPVEPKQMRLL